MILTSRTISVWAAALIASMWGGVARGAPPDDREKPAAFVPSVRVSLDHSRLHWLHDHRGGADNSTTTTSFHAEQRMTTSPAWGGRFRLGITDNRSGGWIGVGFIEGSYGRAAAEPFSLEVAGVSHRWESRPSYWSAAIGAEMQMLRRVLGVGLALGLAGVQNDPNPIEPSGLELERRHKWGMHGTVSLAVHLPGASGFHPGLGAFAGAMVAPKSPLASGVTRRGTRVGLQIFAEWDWSRK